jgi:DNA-binding transcriptional MerR regulator
LNRLTFKSGRRFRVTNMAETPVGRYRIAEVSRLTGFTPSTLRFYEDVGVLSLPERTTAGYGVYGDRDVERLRLVARAKDLGCTLEEIAGLVRAWDADECGPVRGQLRRLVDSKVVELEQHIADQIGSLAELKAATSALATTHAADGPCDDRCGCTAAVSSRVVAQSDGRASHSLPITCSLDGRHQTFGERSYGNHSVLGSRKPRVRARGGIPRVDPFLECRSVDLGRK